jgi:PAS domain S-box-containing protein
LPDALLLVDAAGVVVNANAVALELFEGESAERLLGKPVAVLLPGLGRAVATAGPGPAALPPGSAAPPSAQRAALRHPAERLAAWRTDGTMFPAEVNTAELADDEDGLTLHVVRDLSAVLDVEAELRRQQRQIELILRAASEGIIGVDNEARIVLVNPAGARILRYRAADLGGQDVHELIAHSAADGTPIPPDRCLLVNSLRTGVKHRSTDEVLWRSDGTSVTVDMTTAPVLEGEVIIGAVMTFEDNGEARAALRRARDLAEVLEGELRGPVAAVLAELRNAAEYGIGELGPNLRQTLASATSDLASVAALVDDIVDYQHMVVGDTPCEPRRIALSEVVDAAVDATDEAAATLGVDLMAHTADVEVSVDPELFAKMLTHLLADMVTASPVGGKVVVTAARRGPVARIEIRGPHTGGGPLHLPIARAIVAQHNGTVTTHRIAGKGNTHVVEVPLEGSADGGKGTRASAANMSTRSAHVPQALPASRARSARADHEEGGQGSSAGPAGATSQFAQVEKTNGHHTSHGADARRPLSPTVGGQHAQARIPAQARSTLTRSSGVLPLDLKPSKPLPTSDVWSRPRRTPPEPLTARPDTSTTAEGAAEPKDVTPAARTDVAAGVTPPSEQQPWQPAAELMTEAGDPPKSAKTYAVADEAAQPRGRRRAAMSDPAGEAPVARSAGTASAGADGDGKAAKDAEESLRRPAAAAKTGPVNAMPDSSGPLRGRRAVDDAPTQAMPPVVIAPRSTNPVTRTIGAHEGDTAPTTHAGTTRVSVGTAQTRESPGEEAGAGGPALLLWPEPDDSTLGLLDERGYEAVPLDNFDALPRTLAERSSERSLRPTAVLVDPIAAPITRRGLRILRAAAISEGLPLLVTAGIGGGPAETAHGPDPALLLQSLTPPAVSLPRVLLIEARADLADAMTQGLERQGMQVLHAATDGESIVRASDGVPDVVIMDLMQIRRRRTGIVEWLRERDRLTTTPIVVYTALGSDSQQFAAGLRADHAALYLAERATEAEVSHRIGDLLAKVCT